MRLKRTQLISAALAGLLVAAAFWVPSAAARTYVGVGINVAGPGYGVSAWHGGGSRYGYGGYAGHRYGNYGYGSYGYGGYGGSSWGLGVSSWGGYGPSYGYGYGYGYAPRYRGPSRRGYVQVNVAPSYGYYQPRGYYSPLGVVIHDEPVRRSSGTRYVDDRYDRDYDRGYRDRAVYYDRGY